MGKKEFRVRKGTILGHGHARRAINNQDAVMLGGLSVGETRFHYGAVLDGCTNKVVSGSRNEVGATLLSIFVVNEIHLMLQAGTAIHYIPANLYQRCIGYVNTVARQTVVGNPEHMWEFIQRFMLCTVLGYVMDETTLYVFNAGDGCIFYNNEVEIIEQNDMPQYLAYHCVDKSILGSAAAALESSFTLRTYSVTDMRRFAIGTDGIKDLYKKDPGAIDGMWDYEPHARAGLQWWLNLRGRESAFEDDTTVIAMQTAENDSITETIASENEIKATEEHA